MNDIVPRKSMVKQGTQGFVGTGAGVALLLLNGLGPIGSLILGGIIGLTGLAISRDKDDRTPGLIVAGAGALTAITAIPFVGPIAQGLMIVSGIGLLITGGINLFKFIKNYRDKKRNG